MTEAGTDMPPETGEQFLAILMRMIRDASMTEAVKSIFASKHEGGGVMSADVQELRSIMKTLNQLERWNWAMHVGDAIAEIEALRKAAVGVNVGVKEGDVVGIPVLVRTGRWKWSALGEDGKRFDLVSSEGGLNVGSRWQPMDSAPKEGLEVDLWKAGTRFCGYYWDAEQRGGGAWADVSDRHRHRADRRCIMAPSHWMMPPLPPSEVGVNVGVNDTTPEPTATTSSA